MEADDEHHRRRAVHQATLVLVRHPFRRNVILQPIGRGARYMVFMSQKGKYVPFHGVTKTIQWLCRSYSTLKHTPQSRTLASEALSHGVPGPHASPRPRIVYRYMHAELPGRCKASGGLVHGHRVHVELSVFIKLLHAYLAKKTPLKPLATWHRCIYKQFHRRPDICSRSLIQAFEAQKWIPLATEYNTYDATGATRLATSVDLFVYCLDTQQIALVELKTGYSEHYTTSETSMAVFPGRRPHDEHVLYLSDYTRHLLQVGLSLTLFLRGWHVAIAKAYIVRVSSQGRLVQVYDVTRDALEWGAHAYRALRLLRVGAGSVPP